MRKKKQRQGNCIWKILLFLVAFGLATNWRSLSSYKPTEIPSIGAFAPLFTPSEWSSGIRTDDSFELPSWTWPCNYRPKTPDKCSCIHVKNVCRRSERHKTWFYKSKDDYLNVTLDLTGFFQIGDKRLYPQEFQIQPPPLDFDENRTTCSYLGPRIHMVWTSAFAEMLGEFYVRVYSYFVNLFASWNATTQHKFMDNAQLYLSAASFLTSHETFLGPFSSRPILPFQSFFWPLNKTSIEPTCSCLKDLYLCGFETLTPTFPKYESEPKLYNHPKEVLSQKETHSLIQTKIDRVGESEVEKLRLSWLNQYVSNMTDAPGSISSPYDYTIVGFTQRKMRRKWLGLNRLQDECNRRYFEKYKILSIQVNLEDPEMNNPHQQILVHKSVDALIGIHGAQLTHALFMKPGALVVELLPWILKGLIMGPWTRVAHKPTPLGDMFNETSLLHIGVPLDVRSANHLDCISPQNPENLSTFSCLRQSKNMWDRRDFHVPFDKIWPVFERFIVGRHIHKNTSNYDESCEAYFNRTRDDFVLYNVNCSDSPGKKTIHHFYRHENWVETKTNCTWCTYYKPEDKK